MARLFQRLSQAPEGELARHVKNLVLKTVNDAMYRRHDDATPEELIEILPKLNHLQ